MLDLTSRNSHTNSLPCRKIKFVVRAAKTLVLRFGGLVLAGEICALKFARRTMRNPSLTLLAYRKMRISALVSCLLSLVVSYPSLSFVGAQVRLAPQLEIQEVFDPALRLQVLAGRKLKFENSAPPVDAETSLVQEQAEQDISAVAQRVEQKLLPDFESYNDQYEGLSAFWGDDDIIGNFFANIAQLICDRSRSFWGDIEAIKQGKRPQGNDLSEGAFHASL